MMSIGLVAVATIHLMAIYIAMMGPPISLWLQWHAKRDRLAADLNFYLLWLATAALLLAAALGGLAVLLISQSGPAFADAYLAAARVLPKSRYWPFGVVELLFSLVCFFTAAATSRPPDARRISEGKSGRIPRSRVALPGGKHDPEDASASAPPIAGNISRGRFAFRFAATLLGSLNLVYHFPALFVMLGVLSTRPNVWGRGMKFTALLADPEVLARLAHHLLAALVVSGMALAWYGLRRGGDAARAIVWGSRIALVSLAAQLLSGMLLVVNLPAGSQQQLFGGDALAALFFAGSLATTFFMLPRLAMAALGQTERRATLANILLIAAIVALMTATRHRTRAVSLESLASQRGGSCQKEFGSPCAPSEVWRGTARQELLMTVRRGKTFSVAVMRRRNLLC